ncbi:hypothetical protein GCM10025879_12810 [Leuconostoc litchii]|nr:hypothetical protein GCM10025879_12810 [Leuconostoc litchii]
MNIKLITVGKLKEKYLKEGIAEYSKRLSRFCKVQVIELADEKTPENASDAENNQIMLKEGERIKAKIGSRDYVIVLAIEGQQFPSEEFSKKLIQLQSMVIRILHLLLVDLLVYPRILSKELI